MTTANWFDDMPVVGKMLPGEAAAKLREMGEDEFAEAMEATGTEIAKPSMMTDASALSLRPVRRGSFCAMRALTCATKRSSPWPSTHPTTWMPPKSAN